MPQLNLRYQCSPEFLAHMDSLRGDIPIDDFLNRCIQIGLIHFETEAGFVQKEFIDDEVKARTEQFRKFREMKALATLAAKEGTHKLPSSP